jgi:hypothetical protein
MDGIYFPAETEVAREGCHPVGLKGRRQDSSLHSFPLSPQTTPWGEILPRPGAPTDYKALRDQILVLYGRFVHEFFQRVLHVRGEKLKEMTQDFFVFVLEKDVLKNVTYDKNFRGFLKLACRRFYINRFKAGRAQCRTSEREEALGDRELASPKGAIPEQQFFELFDQEERKRYLEEATSRVRETLRAGGGTVELDLLLAHIGAEGKEPEDYATLARKYTLGVSDVRNRLTKARKLFREALLALAGERSADPETELRELGLYAYLGSAGD